MTWPVDNDVPVFNSTVSVRAAKILSAEPSEPQQNVGFLLTLENVEEEYEVTWNWWIEQGARPGGYVVFDDDGIAAFQEAETFEANHEADAP